MYARGSGRPFRRLVPLRLGRVGDLDALLLAENEAAATEYMRWVDEDDFCVVCCSGEASCCSVIEGPSCAQVACSRIGRLSLLVMSLVMICLIYLAFSSSDDGSKNVSGFGEVAQARIVFNNSRAEEVILKLCQAYENHEVSGDSCNRLCNRKTWNVTEFYEGNKVVVILQDGGQQAVFKSTKPFISSFPKVKDGMNEEAFTDMVLDRVNDLLRLGWPYQYKRHLLETVWPSMVRTPGQKLTRADRNSLNSLLQQEEYVTFRVLPLTRVTPKIIGTCGHFYETESLVAFRMKGYYMNLKSKILVHMMGTLKLFYEFLNEPLQWCDVRFDNLGLSAEYPKRFVVMDGDYLYTQSRLNAIFHKKLCEKDEDCMIGDCHARCTADMTCGDRMNENLDVFCQKLVKPLFNKVSSRGNKYLDACNDMSANFTQRLNELRLHWSWNLSEV